MENINRCLILVDDEQNILFALKRELHDWARDHSLEILIANSAKDALVILETRGNDTALIISDLRMPEMKGSDFLLQVKKTFPDIITILLTGFSEAEEIVKAVRAGIFSYMLKPWDSEYLVAEVQKAFMYGETKKQNDVYRKRLEDELKWAGEMQKTILRPNLPSTTGVEFRVSYRPVPGLYCSGDYYDVISVGTDRYLLLIGDVSGHGVKAAIITGILKAVINPEYIQTLHGKKLSPGELLTWLNTRIQFELRSSSDMFITFFAGIIDLREGTFQYANAGQNHPCVMTDGKVAELPITGSALGFARTSLYTEKTVNFQKNDLLVLYSDGLSEVGKGVKIPQLLQSVPYGPDFHQRILEAALITGGVKEFADDVTILTARRI